ADDLQRFLDGRPVSARPVGAIARGARWCRRNRGVAALSAAVLGTLLISLAVVSTLWLRTESLRRDSETARNRAQTSLQTSTRIINDLIRLGEDPDAPRAETQRARLATLLSEARGLLQENPDDRTVRLTVAELAHWLAQHHAMHGEASQALPLIVEATRLTDRLHEEAPADLAFRMTSARNLVAHAELLRRIDRQWTRGSLELLLRAAARLEPLVRRGDDLSAFVAHTRVRIIHMRAIDEIGRGSEAEAIRIRCRQDLARWLESRPEDLVVCEKLIREVDVLGDFGPREDALRRALGQDPFSDQGLVVPPFVLATAMPAGPDRREAFRDVGSDLLPLADRLDRHLRDDPENADLVTATAYVWLLIGLCHKERERWVEAESAFSRAVEVLETSLDDRSPSALPNLNERCLAECFIQREDARLGASGSADDAEGAVRRLLESAERMVRLSGNRPEWRVRMVREIGRLAMLRRTKGHDDQAAVLLQRAGAQLAKLRAAGANGLDFLLLVCEIGTQIGKRHWEDPDPRLALEGLQDAANAASEAYALAPRQPAIRENLDNRLRRLARFLADRRRFPEAEATHLRRESLWLDEPMKLGWLAADLRLVADDIDKVGATGEADLKCRADCLTHASRLDR
ncbi:MAG: hypothetical protein AB7I30_22725, partial [Isosphaeraceae bacterium]